MKKNIVLKIFLFLFACIYTTTVYCNVVWPAIFVVHALLSSFILIFLSLLIEAFLFYWFIKNISFTKAFFISCIGNIASTFVGTVLMAIMMLLWHAILDDFLVGTFSVPNLIATYFFMYLGSALLELYTIKVIFKYSFKQLRIPVFVGNLITYILIFVFKFLPEIIKPFFKNIL